MVQLSTANFLLAFMLCCAITTLAYGQTPGTRCQTTCAGNFLKNWLYFDFCFWNFLKRFFCLMKPFKDNNQCASGQCSLASCTDFAECYQFCLNCGGSETCYGTGTGCNYTTVVVIQNGTGSIYQPTVLVTTVTSLFAYYYLYKRY